jgi:hypothetical protein
MMAKLLSLKIDVTKINKDRLYHGEKGTYLNLTIAVNDEKNDYGQDVSAWEEQTKEERDGGENKNFLGNGKIFWTDEPPPMGVPVNNEGTGDSDIPF